MRFRLAPRLDRWPLITLNCFRFEFSENFTGRPNRGSSQIWEATTAKQMKIDPHCQRKRCNSLNVLFNIPCVAALLCYTSSTLNPWRNVEKLSLVASPSCTKSFMSMWRCHQTTWIWYLQTDRFDFEELWRNRDWRYSLFHDPVPEILCSIEPSPNWTLFLVALHQKLRYLHSEASWALSHARRRAHLVAVISLWRLATTFQIQSQIHTWLLSRFHIRVSQVFLFSCYFKLILPRRSRAERN